MTQQSSKNKRDRGNHSITGLMRVLKRIGFHATRLDPIATRNDPLLKNFVENRFVEGFSLPRGNSAVTGHTPLDNVHGVAKRKPVGIFIGLQGGSIYFVAGYRWLSTARALHEPLGLRHIAALPAFPEVVLGAQGRQLLRHRDIDELVESHAFGFGDASRLFQY